MLSVFEQLQSFIAAEHGCCGLRCVCVCVEGRMWGEQDSIYSACCCEDQ